MPDIPENGKEKLLGVLAGEVLALEKRIQKMRLIVNGAISLYEGQGLEISALLKAQSRNDLMDVLDNVVGALYWLQEELEIGEEH